MIHTSKTVAVGNQESIIDSPIVLYRGDREVEVEFTLTGNKYTFSNGGNVIKSVNATHGQLVLNTPTGENAFSEVTECHDGKVVFIITKEMIDELIEVGFYSFQIRLFDENQVSRVSIPPVYKGIDIRNPIAAEDETNVVDIGLVDYAVVVKDEFEDLSTFLPDGNYNKTEWESKDVISGAKLNKIEDALYSINSNMEATDLALLNKVENINKTIHGEIDKLGNELESEVEEFELDLNNNVERFKIDINAAMVTHKNEVSEELESVNSQLTNNASKINWTHINETEAVSDDADIDNSSIIKNLLENNDYVKIDGVYYTNEITIDRTGKPPLTIEGNFTLIAKDANNNHLLKFIGQVFHYGRMNLKGENKTINNLVLSTGTARSYFDNVYVEKANANGVYVEYVTLPRFKRLKTHMSGKRLSTEYTRVSGDSTGMILNVSNIDETVFSLNNVHFVIIDDILYKVIDTIFDDTQKIKVYPNNENLSSGSCRILIGTGIFNEGTKLLIDDFDSSSNAVALYTDAHHGITVNHSVIQASPVAFAIGKTGLGSSQFANNVLNAPWLETDIEFPFVLSCSSGSGLTVIEPFTTAKDFNMFTLFGGYPTVTLIKNGRIFENMKNDIYNINSGTRTIDIGKTMLIKSTSGTSQFEIKLVNSNTKKFILNSGETTIYIENKYPRNVNFTSTDSSITIDGTSNLLLENVNKAKVTFILDATKNNLVSFVETY